MSPDRALKGLLAILFVALLFVIRNSFEQRIVEAGQSAPDFRITTDDGKQISLNDFGGKILVLNFWATWCQPCIDEIPSLDEFTREMKGQGVVVLGVSVDRNERIYKSFLQQASPAFLTARDPQTDISASYGTFRYPETYIINRDGKVLQKHIGPQNWMSASIVKQIKALL